MEISKLSTIIILIGIVLINILFGYWRSNTRRFSRQWMMAIHIPIPIAIILRLSFLGWNWLLLPVFVGAFAIGQFSGAQLRKVLKQQGVQLTSFLITDVFRVLSFKLRKAFPVQE